MLKAKAAIVTGSNRGIGLGIARALCAQGANFLLNGFGEPKAIEALMAQLCARYQVEIAYSGADCRGPGR